MDSNETFLFEVKGDTVVITPLVSLGEMEYGRIQTDGKDILERFASVTAKNVVLDLQKTDYLGSTALGFLVRVWNRCRSLGGHMAFCNVSDHHRTVLELTRLDTLWSICGSEDEAISAVHADD